MSDKTGGPAFPPAWNFTDAEPRAPHGMTLRDYFAGQALAGTLNMAAIFTVAAPEGDNGVDPKIIAASCYEIADAMLKERDR